MKRKIITSILFIILLCSVIMLTGCKEAPIVTIASIDKTQTSISFDLSITDADNICIIQKIELIHEGDEPIVATDLSQTIFTGLLSDTQYKLNVTYSYKPGPFSQEKIVTASVTTRTKSKTAPNVEIDDINTEKKKIIFDYKISDPDKICTLAGAELYLGETKVKELTSFDSKEFDGLLSDTEYTVKLIYTYDLNNGEGIKTNIVEKKAKTQKLITPEVELLNVNSNMKNVTFGYNIKDPDKTSCTVTKAEIYLGETKVKELTSFDSKEFDGLLSDTEYTVKLIYTYDLNDGVGIRNGEISEKITTKPIPEPVILLSVDEIGNTSFRYDAEVVTSFTTYKFVKAELTYDGSILATYKDETFKIFTNLSNTEEEYKLKVYYVYDTNSSEGEKEISQEIEIKLGFSSSKYEIKKDWAGQTLLVAATAWGGSPGAPWSTMEIVVKEGQTSGWGWEIDKAVLERTAYIKETYGVNVIWEWSSRYNSHDVLKSAILAGNDPDYDLCMPRAFRAQSIVANGSVYDMANRLYINFDNPYYNDLSVKTYTAKGHTFFLTGDFANLDKETAFVLYFNKTLLGGEAATNALYQKVRDGKWTFDQLVSLANSSYKDDGDGKHGDTDTYGLSTTSLTRFYEYFGVRQAGVDASTGEWKVTLNDPKVNDIVAAIITANTANWVRSAWGGSWGSNAQQALADGRLLFYNEIINHISHVAHIGNLGIVPFPMLNEEQGRYYAPCAGQQTTLMCVPKTTSDRNMSDYFVDVLAWTGREYVMEAYYENMADQVDSAVEMEMIKEYIMPNISYDAGRAVGWGSLMGGVLGASYNGNVNNFAQAYADAEAGVLATIQSWNDAWGAYSE